MSVAFAIELLVGVALLFGGGSWLLAELETLGNRQRRSEARVIELLLLRAPLGIMALAVAAAGCYLLWNALRGGRLLLDADAIRPWLPDRFY